jgi:hypothetical protein
MGFDPAWFAGVVTSGEITHEKLLSRGGGTGEGRWGGGIVPEVKGELAGGGGGCVDSTFASLGDACLHFTWSSRGPVPLDGLGLTTAGRRGG